MLSAMKCPHCRKFLESDSDVGEAIRCPHCEKFFSVSPEFLTQRPKRNSRFAQIAIPLGYVGFVLVPMILTIRFFMNEAEKREEKPAPVPQEVAAEFRPTQREEKKTRPVRPKAPAKKDAPTDPDDPEEAPSPREVTGSTPSAEMSEVAIAPEPREIPEIPIAPEPREIFWKINLLGYTSPWQKVGAVDLRISGIAIAKVPFIDAKEQVTESTGPMFVVLIEARLNTPTKKRELRSWTYGIERYGVIYLEGGKELAPGKRPVGAKINHGIAFNQPLPADGAAVRDVMLFAIPPDGAGELSLRLDADRCGESGDVWFKIPATAFKK